MFSNLLIIHSVISYVTCVVNLRGKRIIKYLRNNDEIFVKSYGKGTKNNL